MVSSTAAALLLTLVLVGVEPRARGAGESCTTSSFVSTEVPRAIPDPGSVTMNLVVPAGRPVSRVEAGVSVSHPFASDVRLELVSPRARRVVLAEAVGTWGGDFSGTTFDDRAKTSIVSSLPPFAGRYRPAESLAAFAGSPRTGTWKLKVSDLRARYSGRIEGWRLDLVSCEGRAKRTAGAGAGAPTPPPLPRGVPAGQEPVEGRLVTVTTSSDAVDGNVSSVQALVARPGFDGISLREAIQATNNDPGTYTIRFDASLEGATIAVTNELPLLRGGGVFVDGDIDGDGRPDVTLVRARALAWALNIASSGNRLHALALSGFDHGVLFTAMRDSNRWTAPLLRGRTFARNVVSGLVLSDIAAPIAQYPTFGHPECERTPCRTGSRWLDTRLVGNTIVSRSSSAIWVGWMNDNGDAMRRVTVAGNRIDVGRKGAGVGLPEGKAVDVTVGNARSSDNRISDALVAYNAIEMRGGGNAVQVLAGQQGRSRNVVEDVRIVGNAVRFSGAPRPATEGIAIFVSDDCWPPGRSDCRNVVRRVEVLRNVLEGQYVGVRVAEPCCNTTSSTVTDVRIAANVIRGIVSAPTEFQNPWGVVIGGQRPGVSKVSIDSNTVVQRAAAVKAASAANLTAGGIAVLGGLGKARTSVRGVTITNNRVETSFVGILVLGGGPSRERAGQDDTIGNRVSRVELRGNVVVHSPALATRWDRRIKGISVIGGLGGTRRWRVMRNAVTCVATKDNVVAGKRDDVAVLPNLGAGASENVARIGRC